MDAYLIDEIGKMECHCPQFVATMRRLLGEPIPLVATIALRGGGFIAEVKQRPDVQIVEVTQGNRAIPAESDRHLGQGTHGSDEYSLRSPESWRRDDGLVRSQQRRGVAATQPGDRG